MSTRRSRARGDDTAATGEERQPVGRAFEALLEMQEWRAAHPGEARSRSFAEEEELATLLSWVCIQATTRDAIAKELERALATARAKLAEPGAKPERMTAALQALGLLDDQAESGVSRGGHDEFAIVYEYVRALFLGADDEPSGAEPEEIQRERESLRAGLLGWRSLPPFASTERPLGLPPAAALELVAAKMHLHSLDAARTRLRRARKRIAADPDAPIRRFLRDAACTFPLPKAEDGRAGSPGRERGSSAGRNVPRRR